jgi:DNA-binding SARP family transcriptional activator/tetratricopeptide (TPR) repeat protein
MLLQLARQPRVVVPGRAPAALAPRDAALLAWLALEGPTPRARLARLLWPESSVEAARNALRQRLFQLKRQFGELISGTTMLALREGVAHDLHDADDVLADETGLEPGELADWLARQRLQRRHRLRDDLVEFAEGAEQARDYAEALGHAHELVALEPLSEEAHRRVMRLHYLAGDRAAALLAFDRCERLLKDEVGARPSAETLALLATIEQAESAAAAGAPVATARVPASVQRPPRLIGRDAERRALHAAWHEGRRIVLAGDGGLGKTRLVTDFAAEWGGGAARSGVLVTSARPGDERVVYASASRLLRAVPAGALRQLPEALRGQLAQLLPELGPAAPLKGESERTRFFNAVAAALDSATLGLDGVVVDDLHFADAASIELFQYAAGATRCRWLVAARAAEVGSAGRAWLDAWLALPETEHVELAPLTLAQIGELVDSLGIAGLDGRASAAALLRHTGGNPLFVLETIKVWLTQGAPGVRSWPVQLPAAGNVAALIERRIGRLSERAVQLARCAAVAAPDFSIELASQVLGLRTLELADPWAELESAQVLRDGAFAHDLIYTAALASVPAPVARQLHAEIAAFLSTRGGEPARLASHWARAERWPEAAAAWLAAARRSRDAGRAVEHAELLAQAAAAWGRAGDRSARFAALLQRATTLASNDVGDAARAAVDELVAAAADDAERLQALGVQLELAITRFEIDAALKLAPQAVAAARAAGDRPLELRFAIAWSGALGDARRVAEGVEVLAPYRAWVDADGTPEQRWEFWEAYALALDYAGRLRESLQGWSTCQALARASGRPDMVWRSLSNTAAGEAKLGRVREACVTSEQARRIALSIGEVGRIRLLQMQAPHAHRLRDVGRYAEALPLLEEALDGLRSGGSATDITMTEQRLALLFMQLGQPARAQPLLATERGGLPPGIVMYQRVLQAELATQLGGDGLATMRDALALIPNPDDVFHRIATMFAARLVPAEEGEALAASLATWAGVRERFGIALAGHVRAAGAAAALSAWTRALPHVEAALDLAREHQPESFYIAELWLVGARVYLGLGRGAEARRVLAAGRDWVMARHAADVPDAFRASFLERNPVNRELLALAASVGRADR